MVNVPKYPDDDVKRVALVQTGAYGDNINSTLMLRPLKEQLGCVIDVYTSTIYGNAFDNNPYIHKLLRYPASDKQTALQLTLDIPPWLSQSNYDIILAPHPMFNSDKWSSHCHPEWGENLILAWVRGLEEQNVRCDKPETILRLTDKEITRAKRAISGIPYPGPRNILMEIHGESGQTFWDHHWTTSVGEYLLDGNTNLFVSNKFKRGDILQLQRDQPERVHWVGNLSLRECAEVFNHCDCFFSVSSGLSNVCNTNWCKQDIKWVEVVNSLTCSSAAIRKDGKLFWHQNDIKKFLEFLKANGL